MSSDPFYVKDSLSSQFDNEDKIRQQKKLEFMEQQKKDYLEYLKMKDNKRTGTPFKITEDEQYHPPIKKLDNQYSNLCTNIAKDNQYSRAGYQINNWKIPDKYEKNFDENYINEVHGFLFNPNRLNVMISRAKTKVVIVGNDKIQKELKTIIWVRK